MNKVSQDIYLVDMYLVALVLHNLGIMIKIYIYLYTHESESVNLSVMSDSL